MAPPCSIETCQRKSSSTCNSCKKVFCKEHLKEHNDQIKSQVNSLTIQVGNLSDRYTKLKSNEFIKDCRKQLEEWRNNCHNTIEHLYQQKCQEFDERYVQKLIKPQKDIDQARSKINESARTQKTIHDDINQSIEMIRYIDQQIKYIEQTRMKLNIRPLSIDESFISFEQLNTENLISNEPLKTKNSTSYEPLQPENIDVFNFSSSYRTIDCSGKTGVAFAASDRSLLVYDNYYLNLFDQDLIFVQQCTWTNGHICDICWSIKLNQFIIITDKRIIYLVNENPLSFAPVQSIPKENWWSSTCSNKYLFLTTYGTDANIVQFNLESSFDPMKRWRSPETCKQHECIHDINYTNEKLALIIADPSNKTARMELRSSVTLERYWSLSLDINDAPYQSTIHICLLKHNEWMIVLENNAKLFHVSPDERKTMTVYEYKQPVWNLLIFASNLLAIRTQNNIVFHKI